MTGAWLFHAMAKWPWPFIAILPCILITITVVGWNRDDRVEYHVNNIWVDTNGDYWKDANYAESLGKQSVGYSNFAAMATSRNGSNLFTASRLEEIRARMEKTEATTIQHDGVTFTWQDICLSNNAGTVGTVYKFPCLRLSPMDLFEEARWFMNEQDRLTWYNDIVGKRLIQPRIPRLGILQHVCTTLSSSGDSTARSDTCNHVWMLRTNVTFAVENGYDPSYANPLYLFDDVGTMELNNPCRICIEQGLEGTSHRLQQTISGVFQVMKSELNRLLQNGNITDTDDLAKLEHLLQQITIITNTVDRRAVEDFLYYYVTRGLYAQLGAATYVTNYAKFMAVWGRACDLVTTNECPRNVTTEQAIDALLQHADNVFSSVTTAGSPFPFWNDVSLFAGTSPVSGSGIFLGGQLLTMAAYLDVAKYETNNWSPRYSGLFMDPLTPETSWTRLVETDPVYRWFLAGVTPMTAHCANGNLTGTATGNKLVDGPTEFGMATQVTQRWCTKYNTPYLEDGRYSQQYFARMWFNLLIDSPQFLGITPGESDPYVWTAGQGCGYTLKGSRFSYTNQSESSILYNASRELYYIDEGVNIGPIHQNLLVGNVTPAVGEYSRDNPLQHVGVIQSIYPALLPSDIVDRVKNCNRPGGPVDITHEDAEQILEIFKEAFEDSWTEGWDNATDGDIQFVGYFDEAGVVGTAGRLLADITLSNGTLTTISIVTIAVFSAIFLFSFDVIASRVLVTIIGIVLVILSFFAALGFGLILGIKISVNIAWTLPFIILGLGIDDIYMILIALKERSGYSENDFIGAMTEVVFPITMTSLVSASMFAVMNIVDVPAVYFTAQVALISVIFLYLTTMLCFPAYCYLDMRRQESRRYDVCFCRKGRYGIHHHTSNNFAYDRVYKPLVLGNETSRCLSHSLVWVCALALFGFGVWGITERNVGLGLEDFFPDDHQASTWATIRTEELASWNVGMNWGALDYKNPETQMKMIAQFESVVTSPHVADIDTKRLWMADFAVWTTRQCEANVYRDDPVVYECGRDQAFPGDGSTCSGAWIKNVYSLREKKFQTDTCQVYEGGICRPTSQMHPTDLLDLGINAIDRGQNINASWCPVFEGWDDEKFQFCIMQWRNVTSGGGGFVLEGESATANPTCLGEYYNDDVVRVPVPFSRGPTIIAIDMSSHDDMLDMIDETRSVCDDDEELHCWMSGIPFDYWEQSAWVENMLLLISLASIVVGFAASSLFLFGMLMYEGNHCTSNIVMASIAGALLIVLTTILSLTAVIGLSVLSDVNVTAFSSTSFVMSVGFAVEYSVHVVHRFLKAPNCIEKPSERVEFAMSFLTLPTFMSFASSSVGVICLAFTQFEFNTIYYFRPLIIVLFVTYFYGCFFLPVLLTRVHFDFLKLGKVPREPSIRGPKRQIYETIPMEVSDTEGEAGCEDISEEEEPDEETPGDSSTNDTCEEDVPTKEAIDEASTGQLDMAIPMNVLDNEDKIIGCQEMEEVPGLDEKILELGQAPSNNAYKVPAHSARPTGEPANNRVDAVFPKEVNGDEDDAQRNGVTELDEDALDEAPSNCAYGEQPTTKLGNTCSFEGLD